MKKITQILFALSFVLLMSCDDFTGEIRKIEKADFEISLPDWIEKTDDLAPHAHYQFKSRYRNTYGIIVKDPKNGKTFAEYQKESVDVLRNFKELTNLLVTDSVSKNGMTSLQLLGDMEAEKVFYWHNTYESSDNFYQLVLWTRSYDRKQKYTETIEDIIASFKIKD